MRTVAFLIAVWGSMLCDALATLLAPQVCYGIPCAHVWPRQHARDMQRYLCTAEFRGGHVATDFSLLIRFGCTVMRLATCDTHDEDCALC